MCYNINTDLHAQQSCPAGKGANESSATNHQKSAFEQCEQREIATEITTVQMVVQDKFHPRVITSSWCSKRPSEHMRGSFRQEEPEVAIQPKHETQHLVYQKPRSSGLLKTTAQCKFQGQRDCHETPLHWKLNVAILSFEEKK